MLLLSFHRASKILSPTPVQKAPCENQFWAIELSLLSSKVCDVTGVVAIACAWHGCFAPNGLVDLFKGEQQKNVDWAFIKTLRTTNIHLEQGVLIYDIFCQYFCHFHKRIGHFLPPNLHIDGRIGSFHVHGHKEECLFQYASQRVGSTAEFTTEVYRLLGIEAAKTTAYHPQADGQTEWVNQELEQYVRLFCSERQNDWADLLPMAEFQYNNHIHSSTQQTPFMLDCGQHPRMGFEPQQPSRLESANEFADQMKTTTEEAKAALSKVKDDMARYYNQRRLPTPTYAVGDMVYLDASDIQTTRLSWKLSHRRLGPFLIERQVSCNAYQLQLPFPMSVRALSGRKRVICRNRRFVRNHTS